MLVRKLIAVPVLALFIAVAVALGGGDAERASAAGLDRAEAQTTTIDAHRYCWCGYHTHWVCYGGYYVIEYWDYWGIIGYGDGGPCW